MCEYKCKFCGKICKNNNSLRNHERLCRSNPNRQLTYYEKYGPINGFNSKGRKAWNKGLTKETDERILKYSETFKRNNKAGLHKLYNPMVDGSLEVKENHKQAMKKVYSNYTRRTPGKFKYGYYKGIWCDSSWELAYLIYSLDHNINIIRNKLAFKYIWNNSIHNYFPDFYLPDKNLYIEIKGYKSDRDEEKINQFSEKLEVIDFEKIKPILTYVENNYGKDFTQLYTSNKSLGE